MKEQALAYKYREGAHGEHCIDVGHIGFIREATMARAATKEDAETIVRELNGWAEQP